ncbi:MAG: HupE/UreJ family protein [Planktomarina sp.]
MSSLLLITLWSGTMAFAHEVRPAVADVSVSADQMQVELLVTVETLLAGIDLTQVSDTDEAPQAAAYDALRALTPAELAVRVQADWPGLQNGMLTKGAGALRLDRVEVTDEPDLELPRDTRLYLSADLDAGDGPVAIGWIAQNGGLVVRHGQGDSAYAAFLEGGELSTDLPRNGGVQESTGAVIWRFLVSGFDHIIPKGLDHILFVLGLFFFSLNLRPLLAQVTAFTLAHTVTLGAATVGIITIPASAMWIVEALIALSITYVAVENILRPRLGWWRIAVVFGFGLLHGLGFASVLGDFGLAQGQFIISLIAFNIGVEVGQLVVILATFGVLVIGAACIKRTDLPAREVAAKDLNVMHRSLSVVGSILIAVVGLWWVVERTVL